VAGLAARRATEPDAHPGRRERQPAPADEPALLSPLPPLSVACIRRRRSQLRLACLSARCPPAAAPAAAVQPLRGSRLLSPDRATGPQPVARRPAPAGP